jgi:hypothetical protein
MHRAAGAKAAVRPATRCGATCTSPSWTTKYSKAPSSLWCPTTSVGGRHQDRRRYQHTRPVPVSRFGRLPSGSAGAGCGPTVTRRRAQSRKPSKPTAPAGETGGAISPSIRRLVLPPGTSARLPPASHRCRRFSVQVGNQANVACRGNRHPSNRLAPRSAPKWLARPDRG